MTADPPKKRKWFPRFSLRTLVLGVCLAGAGFGFWWRWDAWVLGATFPHYGMISNSHKGKYFVTLSNRTLILWNTETGQPVWERSMASHSSRKVSFSPNGAYILLAGLGPTVQLLDASTGNVRIELNGIAKGWKRIQTKSFSPDSKHLVLPVENGRAFIWNTESGKLLSEIKSNEGIQWAWFSPKGRQILSLNKDQSFTLWDASNGKRQIQWQGHSSGMSLLSITSDGKYISQGSDDGTVTVWDFRNGKTLYKIQAHLGHVFPLFSPDGNILFTYSWDGTGRIWKLQTGKQVTALEQNQGPIVEASFAPNGRILTSNGETIRTWDTESGKQLSDLRGYSGRYLLNGLGIIVVNENNGYLWHRRRPEIWWGIAWLWESWACLVLGIGLVWSIWHDYRTLRSKAKAQPEPTV